MTPSLPTWRVQLTDLFNIPKSTIPDLAQLLTPGLPPTKEHSSTEAWMVSQQQCSIPRDADLSTPLPRDSFLHPLSSALASRRTAHFSCIFSHMSQEKKQNLYLRHKTETKSVFHKQADNGFQMITGNRNKCWGIPRNTFTTDLIHIFTSKVLWETIFVCINPWELLYENTVIHVCIVYDTAGDHIPRKECALTTCLHYFISFLYMAKSCLFPTPSQNYNSWHRSRIGFWLYFTNNWQSRIQFRLPFSVLTYISLVIN